ncbi:MAG: Flp pilus assembly protein CpaB [Pirellulales bacterium]|nr:Flp pilus assembly protein CpaB [Pirellulales bacterium]
MRPKSLILLVLALGCGLVAAIGVTQVISKNREPVVQQGDTRSILVAVKDITPGELISAKMVKLEPWPKEKAPEDSLSQIEKVEGCRAQDDIYQGEPIRERKLIGKGVTRQTASDNIPKGYRVVGVKVDMVSGAGLIYPGDRVDIVVHFRKNTGMGVAESRTKTILQDIKVFAIDDTFKLDPKGNAEDSIRGKVIQLLVTPEQAETIVLAQQLGKVQLTMRPPGGDDILSTPGKTVAELLGRVGIGDRSQENAEANASSGGLGGLKSFLDGMKAGKTPVPTLEPPTATADNVWNIRILSGSDLADVTMEESTGPSGEHVWRFGANGGRPAAPPPMIQNTPPQEPSPPPAPPAEPNSGDPGDSGDFVPTEREE